MSSKAATDLRAALEHPLPPTLPAGRATALFLYGHCFHPQQAVTGLTLEIDGARHRPDAVRMPRRDLWEWLQATGEDPEGRSYRSGFWATVTVPDPQPGTLNVSAAVRLADGRQVTVPLADIDVAALPGPEGPPVDPDVIAVCMAAFEPDLGLFAAQVQSLRDQTDARWVCTISDGGSSPERLAAMQAVLGGDPRFRLSPSERRLDPYRNFERALRLAPAGAQLIALCDQDDRWYPDKLQALRAALGSAQLAYCDQRLVDGEGQVLRPSLWQGRRHDRTNLASLLVANSVPGAAMLLRRELAERALPFPRAPGLPYHDHWLALVALASGTLAYIDRPLYDYVQHEAAVQGTVVSGEGGSATTGRSLGWRAAYFGGYLTRRLMAQVLLARCEGRLTARKRRALALMAAAERSPLAFGWLALRPLRRLVGRDETLGGELPLACGVLWRWLVLAAVTGRTGPGRRPWGVVFPDPPRFEQPRLRRWRAGG